MLIIDNAPGNHTNSNSFRSTVVFYPPNATSLLQPKDQGVIKIFKAYVRRFSHLNEAMRQNSELSVKDFSKQFNVWCCKNYIITILEWDFTKNIEWPPEKAVSDTEQIDGINRRSDEYCQIIKFRGGCWWRPRIAGFTQSRANNWRAYRNTWAWSKYSTTWFVRSSWIGKSNDDFVLNRRPKYNWKEVTNFRKKIF